MIISKAIDEISEARQSVIDAINLVSTCNQYQLQDILCRAKVLQSYIYDLIMVIEQKLDTD